VLLGCCAAITERTAAPPDAEARLLTAPISWGLFVSLATLITSVLYLVAPHIPNERLKRCVVYTAVLIAAGWVGGWVVDGDGLSSVESIINGTHPDRRNPDPDPSHTSGLPGIVDGVVSSVLGLFSLITAGTLAESALRALFCFPSYLGFSIPFLGNLCIASNLAIAAAVFLFLSFVVTAVFGFLAMVRGEGMVPCGGARGRWQ